jgi:predicted metal-dependent peptidase
MSSNRKAFDEAVSNMAIASSPFFNDYVFYLHVLSQCKVVFKEDLPAPAGVTFHNDHYVLYINPTEVISTLPDGTEWLGFCERMPLAHRIGIIKHEMLHIVLGHLFRSKDLEHYKYNLASDCALNQQINSDHLPNGAVYPENFPNKKAKDHLNETAELYYSLLESQDNNHNNDDNDDNGKEPYAIDDHSVWKEITGDQYVQQEITKKMTEKAASDTQKSKGNLPQNYSQIIDNLTHKREVDWKRVLRSIVGNKKANKRKTLMRRDRRLPFANWIKGTTKDRVLELGVVSDVSGSVCNEALHSLWGEIINICKVYNTPVTMVQVDTQPSKPQELSKGVKTVERKACGGTYLSPAIEKFKEYKVNYDALVITTDGYLFDEDITPFQELNIPIVWLIEPNGQLMSQMNNGKMKGIKLKE